MVQWRYYCSMVDGSSCGLINVSVVVVLINVVEVGSAR